MTQKNSYLLTIFILLLSINGFAFTKPGITKKFFGEFKGRPVHEYTLTNRNGMQVKVINLGASITDIITADKQGHLSSVVLGFDSLSTYTGPQNALMGAVVGRVANRIAGAKFNLEGKEYQLSADIHGGKQGFDRKFWDAKEIKKAKEAVLKMTYYSEDGEEGYPGNLNVSVTYTLTGQNELKIDYLATTDKTTHVNLTNHSYFNLSGGRSATITGTRLRIFSDKFLEADKKNIPTGRILDVKDSPLDFSDFQEIGAGIGADHPSLKSDNGYDLTYVLRNQHGKSELAAEAFEPLSGRMLRVYTTEPGLVFYTGNHLNPGVKGHGQIPSTKYAAFCLETQHYPDSPNQPKFPGTVLKAGQTYKSQTIFAFSVRK